jgi:hypothetical protein
MTRRAGEKPDTREDQITDKVIPPLVSACVAIASPSPSFGGHAGEVAREKMTQERRRVKWKIRN